MVNVIAKLDYMKPDNEPYNDQITSYMVKRDGNCYLYIWSNFGGSTSSRGGRSGLDRYSSRGGSTQYNSPEYGGLHGKPRRENGTSSYTSSSAPAYGVAAPNTNRSPPTFRQIQVKQPDAMLAKKISFKGRLTKEMKDIPSGIRCEGYVVNRVHFYLILALYRHLNICLKLDKANLMVLAA